MQQYRSQSSRCVNCRVGSLEIFVFSKIIVSHVNCRVGSLENERAYDTVVEVVNCRVGSLEIQHQ